MSGTRRPETSALPGEGQRGGGMETAALDHVVVAVHDVEEARLSYAKVFGEAAVGPVIEAEAYRRCIVEVAGQRVELCQPLPTDDPREAQASNAFARTLSSRGEGLHSIAVGVHDVAAAAAGLEESGVPILLSSFSPSFFVHPRALNGVIVQILEADRTQGAPRGGRGAGSLDTRWASWKDKS